MKTQIESPALANSRFRFNDVLFLDVNFYQLNLTWGSSYIPLSDWLANKKVINNSKNSDKGCFKWSLLAAYEFTEPWMIELELRNKRLMAGTYTREDNWLTSLKERSNLPNLTKNPWMNRKNKLADIIDMVFNLDELDNSKTSKMGHLATLYIMWLLMTILHIWNPTPLIIRNLRMDRSCLWPWE